MCSSDIICLLVVLVIVLIMFSGCNKDYFTLSRKPFEEDWSLLNMNPFDNMDYETPTMYTLKY